jgi:hypothetical protein
MYDFKKSPNIKLVEDKGMKRLVNSGAETIKGYITGSKGLCQVRLENSITSTEQKNNNMTHIFVIINEENHLSKEA